ERPVSWSFITMSNNIKNLKKGELLFQEGDTPDAMYIIKSGRLAITKKKGNTDITLAELKTGDLLGEMAFFDKAPRSAGAKAAMNNTEVIELPFRALEAQWANLPAWVKSIVKAINGHLRRANNRIRQLEKTQKEEKEVFSDHAITALMSILGFVAYRYGEENEHGLQVPAGILRNFTIQVFQQATHKMNTLCEVLADFNYMKIEDIGEGKKRMVMNDVDFIFRFVEFYNNQLFSEQAKKFNVNHHQMKTLKVAKHYGEQMEPDAKGFVKLNVTEISQVCFKEMGQKDRNFSNNSTERPLVSITIQFSFPGR
ncbi:MAG: cyclic nucleotide-binding domain-containing protein, partial [Pseudomonadota bacterium]